MLFLLSQTRVGCFVIPSQRILEVLPMVSVSALAGLPPGITGVMQCRGASVPVIDLTHLTSGCPAPASMTTRVLLMKWNQEPEPERLFGLIVERATRMISISQDRFSPSPDAGGLPFLGPVAWEGAVAMQRIEVDRLAELLAPEKFKDPQHPPRSRLVA